MVEWVILLELGYARDDDIRVFLMLGMAFIVGRREFEVVRSLVRASFAITVFAAITEVAIASSEGIGSEFLWLTSLRRGHGGE